MDHFDKRNPHVPLRPLRHSVASEILVMGLFKMEICHLIDRRKVIGLESRRMGACTEMIPREPKSAWEDYSRQTPFVGVLAVWQHVPRSESEAPRGRSYE